MSQASVKLTSDDLAKLTVVEEKGSRDNDGTMNASEDGDLHKSCRQRLY